MGKIALPRARSGADACGDFAHAVASLVLSAWAKSPPVRAHPLRRGRAILPTLRRRFDMTETWSGINRSTMVRQPNPPEGPICIKNEYTTSFRLDPNDPPNSDGREFDAMSDEERHQAALFDPACPLATAAQLACARRVHTVLPCAKT